MIREPLIAKKHLGQNFLRNKNILNTIIDADTLLGESIIEIGPGLGDLTECLLSKNPESLKVIELDADMIPLLHQRFGDKIDIYHHDVLGINIIKRGVKYDTTIVVPTPYRVYGNIPYYITSPILMHFLYEIEHLPDSLTLTMQKEVADRILVRDGKHSVLSLACQLVADIKKICDISPNNFDPIPKVWSTCLRLNIKSDYDRTLNKKILTVVKQGFAQKRKKLSSNLIHAGYTNTTVLEAFLSAGISENTRAEELSLEDWEMLTQKIL